MVLDYLLHCIHDDYVIKIDVDSTQNLLVLQC